MSAICNKPPRKTCILALAGAGLVVANGAFAATATTSFSVTATVLAFCAVSAAPLVFGNYSAAQLDGHTTVTVTCTSGTGYQVGLDAGTGNGASVATRRMTGSGLLNYTLYTDSSRTTVFGNTVGTNTVSGTGSGVVQSIDVYGRIPAGQYPAGGLYSDTITVSVTY